LFFSRVYGGDIHDLQAEAAEYVESPGYR